MQEICYFKIFCYFNGKIAYIILVFIYLLTVLNYYYFFFIFICFGSIIMINKRLFN